MTFEENPNLLLTQKLRDTVNAKIRECYDIAEAHYGVKIPFPTVRYDLKNTWSGASLVKQPVLRFNLILLVENKEKFLATTVVHECAHQIVEHVFRSKMLAEGRKRIKAHGKEWQEVMQLLNTPANDKHSYDCSSIETTARSKSPRRSKAEQIINLLQIVSRKCNKLKPDDRKELRELLYMSSMTSIDTITGEDL